MSTNKSKIPLDKEFAPKPSMVVKTIDMNEKAEQAPISTGVKLVEATQMEELQISEEELKMAADNTNGITDITDFGDFAPTQVVNVEDATEFPTLDGTVGIIQDSDELKTK